MTSPPLEVHLSRSQDRFECIHLTEPDLLFAGNQRCPDPRTGIGAYGPFYRGTSAGKFRLRLGIVGTADAINKARGFLDEISRPIEQDPSRDSVLYPSFPGLNSGHPFSLDFLTLPAVAREVNSEKLQSAQNESDPIAAYSAIRELFAEPVRAMSMLAEPPDVVLCAVPKWIEPKFLKAGCSEFVSIEIICDGRPWDVQSVREDRATEAWNFSIRLLHKAGLPPWRLADAEGDSCFVGISFHRERNGKSPSTWTSLAHIVNELGEGLVVEGDRFAPSHGSEFSAGPHLDTMQAARTLSRALENFERRFGRVPRKLVVHKTSSYSEAERAGFEFSLRNVPTHALIAVSRRGLLFLRPGREPIFRGAAIPFSEKLGLVYTAGYNPFLRCSPDNRMPVPIEISENWGSMSFQEAANDLLRLTKLNWKSTAFSSAAPLTFASTAQAGEILAILGQHHLVLGDRSYL